jgi:glucose-1-phosphate cytidylyltransferase
MKVVILAGGLGSRLSEETELKPKPMVEIGGKPILWHIMKIYSYYGFNDFVVLTGYKSHVIKEYFINYYTRYSDITVDMQAQSVEIHKTRTEDWKVTLLYTGQDTMTGGRIKKAQAHIGHQPFLLTYGDGVADVDIPASIADHQASGKLATMTVVQPTGRFGAVSIDASNQITSFEEKPASGGAWINGGFFVLEPSIFDYLPENDPSITWERSPIEQLAADGQLNAFHHQGFWRPMDTLRDKNDLNELWFAHKAPWKKWT